MKLETTLTDAEMLRALQIYSGARAVAAARAELNTAMSLCENQADYVELAAVLGDLNRAQRTLQDLADGTLQERQELDA